MVKTGAERSQKYDAKYDPEALLLRWKALRDWSMEKFRSTAFKQYLVQYVANKLYEDYEIEYVFRGRMHDKVEKLLFKYDTLTEPQLDAMREDWIREDLPETAFDEIPDLFASLKPLFEVCAYPTSKLFSRISVDPLPYETEFPIEHDFLDPITEILTELSELEILDLISERKEVGILETKVCAHNTVRVMAPLLNVPTISIEIIEKEVTFDIAVAFHIAYKEEPTLNIGVVKTP